MTTLSDGAPRPLLHLGPRQMPCLPILKAGPDRDQPEIYENTLIECMTTGLMRDIEKQT